MPAVLTDTLLELIEGTPARPAQARSGSLTPRPEPSASPAGPSLVRRTIQIGRSVDGLPILASQIGDPESLHTILVVGCIHGSECAGIPVARDLRSDPPPSGLDLWLIPDLNPDGFAAGTRQNGRGVDLNRNFPWRWRAIGGPGAWDYSGPHPLSEPESRAARALIVRTHPRITIWFHQDEALVDESGGRVAIERRYAHLVGLPLVRLTRYPGSVASWENHRLPGSTAFVVELPPGPLSGADVERFADAVLRLTGMA